MASRNKPRSGSIAYKPRKRVKKETPRVHSWPESKDVKLLGFAGYKAGMTHVMAVDNRKNSPTSGLEIFVPVTILDAPPMKIAGVRLYQKGYQGFESLTDVWADEVSPELKKRVNVSGKKQVKKTLSEFKADVLADVRLLMHTQPVLTPLPKKKADLMEIALGGTVGDKLKYAQEMLGKSVDVKGAFGENSFVDVVAVTKGKGFQGIIKRMGTRRQPRKSTGRRRHMGTGGSWTPAKKFWCEPMPGQMGYHTRTEYNKFLLKIGNNGREVTPVGGFLNYGPVKGDYVMVYGSLPGPAKRIIRMVTHRRPKDEINLEVTHINLDSKQGA